MLQNSFGRNAFHWIEFEHLLHQMDFNVSDAFNLIKNSNFSNKFIHLWGIIGETYYWLQVDLFIHLQSREIIRHVFHFWPCTLIWDTQDSIEKTNISSSLEKTLCHCLSYWILLTQRFCKFDLFPNRLGKAVSAKTVRQKYNQLTKHQFLVCICLYPKELLAIGTIK